MNYNLSHLSQPEHQRVFGPIQDDEALLLYSIIRVTRLKNIIEIGGLGGYSASNFLAAVGSQGIVYTVDINPVPKLAHNHVVIQKDCGLITSDDVPNKIELIFFDAHDYAAQKSLYHTLLQHNIIDNNVILAIHDTNLHPNKYVERSYYMEDDGGWVHQHVERELVTYFKSLGFDAISFHTKIDEPTIEFRHGITIMKMFKSLSR